MQGFALGQATPFQSQILMLKAGEPSEVREGAAPVNLSGTLTYALSDSKAVPSATLSYLILSRRPLTLGWVKYLSLVAQPG